MKAVIKVDSDAIDLLAESMICPGDIGLKVKKCAELEAAATLDDCKKCFKKAFKKARYMSK